MSRRRGTAVALALLGAALAAAGCGLGPGEDVGDVSLTVTRDYGREEILGVSGEAVSESDTVMRVLEGSAEISTRYGGGFVQSIDGLEAERSGGRTWDWLFYVNGVESPVGAADYPLHGGEAIWWDYREWSATPRVPAVVGSWPQPFLDGYEGERRPVAVECHAGGAACGEVESRLEAAGATVASGVPEGAIRVLVGPWARLRGDPVAAPIEDGLEASGVFADFEPRGGGFVLVGLDEGGEPSRAFGPDAGLVAATRRYGGPPVWLVSGATAAGVRAAAGLLDSASLRDRYAVAIEDGEEEPLPLSP
ncbi:MAG TPA: DUF4430 domain-containing protein [Solirubrobacterales bacterium]|nr:DUF4430 domain-containing protein [Solirubrobacterales bacterium]